MTDPCADVHQYGCPHRPRTSDRDALAALLTAYAQTKDHENWCAATSEGQSCCIDADHPKIGDLLDAILTRWRLTPVQPDPSPG